MHKKTRLQSSLAHSRQLVTKVGPAPLRNWPVGRVYAAGQQVNLLGNDTPDIGQNTGVSACSFSCFDKSPENSAEVPA